MVYSIDLSSATDRLPLVYQIVLISLIMGSKDLSLRWGKTICSIPYHFGPKEGSKTINYGVGQGIGLYSSWAMLALANHSLILLAADMAGVQYRFRDYLVLGDDVVIADALVAEIYIDLLSKLGVKVSKPKTTVSRQGSGCEFASQLLVDGIIYNPLPMGLVLEGSVDRLFSLWRHFQ